MGGLVNYKHPVRSLNIKETVKDLKSAPKVHYTVTEWDFEMLFSR